MSDYNPPVNNQGSTGTPASTTGVVVNIPGGSPFTPPSDAATNRPPGGSPSFDSGAGTPATVTSLTPNTAVVGGAILTMVVAGTGFTPQSRINFNGGIEETNYASPTEVSTYVRPSTASGPATVPVGVQNGAALSNTQDFTFTATQEE